jgi:hypothetical protein
MRARLLAFAAAATAVTLTLPAHAASSKPQLKDAKGDSPVAGADIVSAQFTSVFKTVKAHHKKKKVTTGFTLTLTLAAPPASQVWYQIQAATQGCPTFDFEYSTNAVGGGPTGARCEGPNFTTKYTTKVAAPKVSGNSLIWTVPARLIPIGTSYSKITATTYNFVAVPGAGSLGAPSWDQAAAPASASFTVGS